MNNEMDLGKVILDLWDGKWKIIKSTIVIFIIALGFIFAQPKPEPSYKIIAKIKPINSYEAIKYYSINSYDFFNITPQILHDLYIEQIDYKVLFLNVIKDLDIFKKSDYETEKDYNNAILGFASKLNLLPPSNKNEAELKNEEVRKYHQLILSHTDKESMKNIITEYHKTIEEYVRNELIQRFNLKVSVINQKKIFELQNIRILKDNAFEDYDKRIKIRLAYLNEQKQIARKLGIAKSTIETQMFDTKNGAVVNFKTDRPFYLNGYEAIEKEIELINNRDKKSMFIDNLLELEKNERALKQDKTLERLELVFKSSPLMEKKNFVAVNLDVGETVNKERQTNYKKLIFAIFIGLFVGSIYVLLSNALRSRRH